MQAFQVLSFEYGDYLTGSMDYAESHAKWRGLADSMNHQENDEEVDEVVPKDFQVKIYGRDSMGRSVCVVSPFFPYFYVGMPQGWTDVDARELGERIYLTVCKFYPGSLVSCQSVDKLKFSGFYGDNKFSMYKLTFRNAHAAKICANRFLKGPLKVWKKENLERLFVVFEGNVDPILRFIHATGIESTGWVSVSETLACRERDRTSRCDLEYRCKSPDDLIPLRSEKIAPLVIASFDIEVYSPDGSFPVASDPGCSVIQIATMVQRYGESEPFAKHVVTLKDCGAIEGVEVESYDSEREVLEAWSRFLRRVDPDILTGYNIHGFDSAYIFARAEFSGAGADFFGIGKDLSNVSVLVEKTMSSNAYGHNEFKYFSSPGILQLDVLTAVKRDFKLDSYRLDAVAKHFLGEAKLDLPPKEIFAMFRAGSPEDIRRVAEYAVQDTALPLKLIWKLSLIPNMTEMAKVTGIPCDFLMKRGQQIRVYSLILKYAMRLGYVLPTNSKDKKTGDEEEEGYTGATVLDPKAGAYMTPVAALDFASLYPSILIAHNLCHTTLVSEPRYDDLPAFSYETVSWEEGGKSYSYRFVSSRKGVLPQILEDLAASRRAAKKDMAAATDPFTKSLYNGKQLAYKVVSNSIYGSCGASTGMLPCKPIAACVTNIGRTMIAKSKALAEASYAGCEVLYGDSVTADTPVIVRKNGEVSVCEIRWLASEAWSPYPGFKHGVDKQQGKCDAEVWSENRWAKVARVIRHTTTKRVFRVNTGMGSIDVTEDHSLLKDDGDPIRPEGSEGESLLHSFPIDFPEEEQGLTTERAWLWGLFAGHGYCGEDADGPFWAIESTSPQILLQAIEVIGILHPGVRFHIGAKALYANRRLGIRHPNGMSRLSILKPASFARDYSKLFFQHGVRAVPKAVLNSLPDIKFHFLAGFEGECSGNGGTMKCKSKLLAQGLYYLAASVDKNGSIVVVEEGPGEFVLSRSPRDGRVKNVTELEEKERVVYDLETVTGRFHAGVGSIVVKNTDSIFVKFPADDMKEVFRLGEEAAAMITGTFRRPIE